MTNIWMLTCIPPVTAGPRGGQTKSLREKKRGNMELGAGLAAQYLQCVVLAGRHDAVTLAQQAVDWALVGTQRRQAVAAYGVLPQALGTNVAQAVLSGVTWTGRVTHEVNLSALPDQLVKKLLPLNHWLPQPNYTKTKTFVPEKQNSTPLTTTAQGGLTATAQYKNLNLCTVHCHSARRRKKLNFCTVHCHSTRRKKKHLHHWLS